MYILFLVSGNAATILSQCSIDAANVKEVKIEEKMIASFGTLRAVLREGSWQGIIWGCRDLRYQRFQALMKIYMLLTFHRGFIADEQGHINKYGIWSFVLKDAPSLALELFVGCGVLVFSFIRLPLFKRQIVRRFRQ
jgi:hypothetical protein